jgi:hypothetical protein
MKSDLKSIECRNETEAALVRSFELCIAPYMEAAWRVVIDCDRYSGGASEGFPEEIQEGDLFFDAEAHGRGGQRVHGYGHSPQVALERLVIALREAALKWADGTEKNALSSLEYARVVRAIAEV